jgi:SAM-dependent methyltransferase
MNQHGHVHDAGHVHDVDWGQMVAFAEREAEVLSPFLDEATATLAEIVGRDGLEVRRIIDIGSGPGVGTCVLAERFPAATVLAADGSEEMLANVVARAERLGLAERVATQVVELPGGLDDLGPADLVWASLVLHHVGDERAALRGLRARLGQGGLLALVEFGGPLRVLPDDVDLGRPGLWDRLHTARARWLSDMRAGLPDSVESGDYRTMVEEAGFEVLVDRVVPIDLDPPLDPKARRVALDNVTRTREHVEGFADADDLAVLDRLVDEDDPAGILRRPDAFIHASRHLFVARAAGDG